MEAESYDILMMKRNAVFCAENRIYPCQRDSFNNKKNTSRTLY